MRTVFVRTLFLTAVLLAADTSAASAVEATFLGTSTYATPADCKKVAKLAAGAPRNLNSVPETLTAKGYQGWEGGCSIEKFVPKGAGKSWTVSLLCSEGSIENAKSTQTWTKGADGSLTVVAGREKTRFVACSAPNKK